jgi:hypothetical protein
MFPKEHLTPQKRDYIYWEYISIFKIIISELAGGLHTYIKAPHTRDFFVRTSQYCSIMIKEWIWVRKRVKEWTITDFLKTNTNRIKDWIKIGKSVTFFRIPTVNIPANTEVEILSIRERVSIQEAFRDGDWGFRIIPGSIITLGTLILLVAGHGEARFHIPLMPFFIILSAYIIEYMYNKKIE